MGIKISRKASEESKFDPKTNIASELRLLSSKQVLRLDFGTQIMIDNNFLTTWTRGTDLIDISIFPIVNKAIDFSKKKNFQINISKLMLGKSVIDQDYELTNFVSYVRKSDLKYKQDYFETFVIIIINKNIIELIPFDWFNKTGGDYGYVWPALAQLDLNNYRITGKGMRMHDFTIDLNK